MTVSAYGKRFVAWLGIAGMLLLVCAPTVSRLLAATHDFTLSLCTEAAGHGTAPVAVKVLLDDRHDASGKQTGSHVLDDCGYCTLMAHDAALPPVPPALPSALWLIVLALVLAPLCRYTPIGAFPSGRPRAPPRFS